MEIEKEISLRNAISYCIENNDVNTATNRIMEFIRDEKEVVELRNIIVKSEKLKCDCCDSLNVKVLEEGLKHCIDCDRLWNF